MKSLLPLVASLTLIAAGAGLALALVYAVTEGPIAAAELENTRRTVRAVLPAFDESLLKEIPFGEGEDSRIFYVANDAGGNVVGIAFASSNPEGYGGAIEIMIGAVPDGDTYKINRIEVLRHLETPGLGSKAKEQPFKSQFNGTDRSSCTFQVKKDNNSPQSIDAITGATITSRAVSSAAGDGLDYFMEHRDEIIDLSKESGGRK